MKPTRNRVYCDGVRISKMLFEPRGKADNFIKFNSTEILGENGKASVRSYYCVFCGDWHVTSNISTIASEHLDDRDNGIIPMVMESKEKEKNTKEISSYKRNDR